MDIEIFQPKHIDDALIIARGNYEEERHGVPVLPAPDNFPDLGEFADNRLGVVLLENGVLSGYLGCYRPDDSEIHKRVFSPIQAHGAIKKNRGKIYSYLYQSAARIWAKQGIGSHSIALYAHDTEGLESFFWNGFGLYCIDAVRALEPLNCEKVTDCDLEELPISEVDKIVSLKYGLISHLGESPMFLKYPRFSETQLIDKTRMRHSRLFCAIKNNQIIAFIEIAPSGENFITYDKKMTNICGAYLIPEYRGTGLFANLLQFLIRQLKKEGFMRLGVDFESFNPTAKGFWLKYFTPYTKTVTRTILV